MNDNNSSLKVKLQATLDRAKSLAAIMADIKHIQPRVKIRFPGALDEAATKKAITASLKPIDPKVKIDADPSQAEKKIQKLSQQKSNTVIQATVDNSQALSSLKETGKETKNFLDKFSKGAIGANLIRMSVQNVIQAISEAIHGIKELDDIKTNIQMGTGFSDSNVDAMMGSYNSIAKELSVTTKEVASAANEFLRMGETASSANELIKSSQVLSKVGMIDSAEAANYLMSSLKGYQVAATDSMDIVNKLTAVDLEAAVSAGGLAEALAKCADTASNSGISMDKLIGYTAVVGESTNHSMAEVGESFQSLLNRMNNMKIGNFIDDETGESLSDTESALNTFGIKLRDTEDTYRSFDAILNDVGTRWETFSQAEQDAISAAIAGSRQGETFEALMDNWGNALSYSETAANSAGAALAQYGVYQDSIGAKSNELTAAIESLKSSLAKLVALDTAKLFTSMETSHAI